MRKIFTLGLALVLAASFIGCKIGESGSHRFIAYLAGKGVGFTINTIAEDADKALVNSWGEMMDRNKDVDVIPTDEVIRFFNDSITRLTPLVGDPYGLVADLAEFLSIFGAEYDSEGNLVNIEPIPKPVMNSFGRGYVNGRTVALRERR